jgi:hypothetical protein
MLGASLITLSQLRKVSFSYLTMVWKTVDGFLTALDPPISNDPLFSSIRFYQPPPYNFSDARRSQSVRDLVDSNTTWNNSYGYRLWHTFYGRNSDEIGWFSNKAIRHILHQTLANSRSRATYIGVIEYIANPAHPREVAFIGPSTIFVVEMITFVLAWVSPNRLVDYELIRICLFSLS